MTAIIDVPGCNAARAVREVAAGVRYPTLDLV
jgi:hypothetical protein